MNTPALFQPYRPKCHTKQSVPYVTQWTAPYCTRYEHCRSVSTIQTELSHQTVPYVTQWTAPYCTRYEHCRSVANIKTELPHQTPLSNKTGVYFEHHSDMSADTGQIIEVCTSTFCFRRYKATGPGSSFGIAIAYGLNGPGIKSRWGENFRTCPDRPWGPLSVL